MTVHRATAVARLRRYIEAHDSAGHRDPQAIAASARHPDGAHAPVFIDDLRALLDGERAGTHPGAYELPPPCACGARTGHRSTPRCGPDTPTRSTPGPDRSDTMPRTTLAQQTAGPDEMGRPW